MNTSKKENIRRTRCTWSSYTPLCNKPKANSNVLKCRCDDILCAQENWMLTGSRKEALCHKYGLWCTIVTTKAATMDRYAYHFICAPARDESSRKCTTQYFLPIDDSGDQVSVCRTFFFNTQRHVRTTLMISSNGVLAEERKADAIRKMKKSGVRIKWLVTTYINRYLPESWVTLLSRGYIVWKFVKRINTNFLVPNLRRHASSWWRPGHTSLLLPVFVQIETEISQIPEGIMRYMWTIWLRKSAISHPKTASPVIMLKKRR